MVIALWDIFFQGLRQKEMGTVHFETRFERVMIVIYKRITKPKATTSPGSASRHFTT
jgi:hypothetical protein